MIKYWLPLAAALWALSVSVCAAAPTAFASYDMRSGKVVSQTELLDRLAQADVVCLGEQHTDPATHQLELTLLEALHQRVGKRLTLGMEMWERDVQPSLSAYLAGRTEESAFLKASRPWSNYQTDYRPLVEYAKANGIPIIASNVPQSLATAVGRRGLDALKDVPPGQSATDISAPHDQAWTRFRAVMLSMGGDHGGMTMDEDHHRPLLRRPGCPRRDNGRQYCPHIGHDPRRVCSARQRPVPLRLRRRHPPPHRLASSFDQSTDRLHHPRSRPNQSRPARRQLSRRLHRLRSRPTAITTSACLPGYNKVYLLETKLCA